MNKYIAALAVDKVQTFLTEVINSHVQERESEEATLSGIINSSDQISKEFFKTIYKEFPEAEENTLMKCSGVFIFSSDRSEEELKKSMNYLFVDKYKESQGQKILRWVCFPSEGLDEISAIKKAKKHLKQVKTQNRMIKENVDLLFTFCKSKKTDRECYTAGRDLKKFSTFVQELNDLKLKQREEESRFRIAVIKADLDGMGKMFRKIDKYEDYKVISEILNREISLEGLNKIAKQFIPDERERWIFPLYIAGDDIFFAVAVEDMLRGVDVCRQLMKNINKKIKEKGIRDKKLGISLGIEITFNKEPIRYYMERVESQLRNAKRQTTPEEIEKFLIMKISVGNLTFFDIDYYAMKNRKNGMKEKAELSWQMQNVSIWNYFISDIKFLNYIRTTGGKCSDLLGKPNFFYTLLKDVTDEETYSDNIKYINHVLYRLEPKYLEHSCCELKEAELILNSNLIKQLYRRDEHGFKIVVDDSTKQRFQAYLRLMIFFSDIRFKLFKDKTENPEKNINKKKLDIFQKKKSDIRRLLFSKPREYLYEHCLKARSKELTDVFVRKVSLPGGKKVGYQKVSLERSAFFRLKTPGISPEKVADIMALHNQMDKEEIDIINKKREEQGKLPNKLWFDKQKMIKKARKTGLWTADYVDSLMLFYSYNEMFMKLKK